jgi:hypothetical protein
MGIMRMDNADDTAKTALSIARSGDTDALSKFMKEVTTDRVSSLVQEPGQMALLVKEYAKQESAADRQILPQLVLAADGKDISVVAAKVTCRRSSKILPTLTNPSLPSIRHLAASAHVPQVSTKVSGQIVM